MKKIFTLLLSIGLLSSVFAQQSGNGRGYQKNNDYGYNDNRNGKSNDRFDDHYSFSKRELDMKIADINHDYDRKINDVRNNWFMNRVKKERMIYKLEDQRKSEIRMAYTKFNDKHNRFADNGHDWHR